MSLRLIEGGQRAHDWPRIERLSRDMLAAARAGEWARVGELEAERGELIGQFFAQSLDAADAQALADGIRRVLESDRLTLSLGGDEREALKERMTGLARGSKAAHAYQANSG